MNNRSKYLLQQLPTPNFGIPGLHQLPDDTLHAAAAIGYLTEMQGLLAAQPQLADQPHSIEGTIPLCWALQNNQTQAVELLIDYSHLPRVAPLPHHSPLHYLNSKWATANPELTKKLFTNIMNTLDFSYAFALDSLNCLELSTLIQNYLLIAKHGNLRFLATLDIGTKIEACLNKLYVSDNEHGFKTFYTLIAWINLSVCKSMFNMHSRADRVLILDVVKNINLDNENFQQSFMHAIRKLSPAYNNLIIENTLAAGDNRHYLFFPIHSPIHIFIKGELALVLFDAGDYEVHPDLAEKLYKDIEESQNCHPDILSSLKQLVDSVNNANPHLAANAIVALKNETTMNSFKAAIILRMIMQAATDRKMSHTADGNPRLIIGAIEKAITLICGLSLNYKNNYLGDLFEAAGDAYRTNLLLRYNDVYPVDPLKHLYHTAGTLQVSPPSLHSTHNKLLAISAFEDVQSAQPSSLPSMAGLFGRLRIRSQASTTGEAVNQHSKRIRAAS